MDIRRAPFRARDFATRRDRRDQGNPRVDCPH